MQARPTYYMSSAAAEILERHRPGYIAALLERAELCLTDRPFAGLSAADPVTREQSAPLKEDLQ